MDGTARQTSHEAQRGFGTREVLTLLIRRRWIILGVALPIIFFAGLGTLRTAEVVTASSRVVIEAKTPQTPTFSTSSVNYDVLMSTAAQVAMSIPVAERAAVALADTLRGAAVQPGFPRFGSQRELRRALLRGVNCNQVGESNILSIFFSHPNPKFALLAVEAITNAYMAYSIQIQQNTPAIEYYTDQIRAVQQDIDVLLKERAAVLTAAGYGAFEAVGRSGVDFLRGMEGELQVARSKRQGLQAKLDGIVAAIERDPDFVPPLGSGEDAILVALKGRLEEAKSDLAKLEVQYTSDSYWVSRQARLVDMARRELNAERGNYIEDLRIRILESQGLEDSFADIVTRQRSELAAYPEVEHRISSLDMMIATQRDLLENLQMKRGEVRLQAGTDARISSIVPLNEPAIETRVAGSKKVLYLGLAAIFALVLGLISAFFVDKQDHRIFDRQGAEQNLDLPVLGAVSRSRELAPRS